MSSSTAAGTPSPGSGASGSEGLSGADMMGPATRGPTRVTYHNIFSIGLYFLVVLVLAAMLWSFLSSRSSDWLVEGRYVDLTPERYQPGTVTHFAFDEWRPPRPMGFFLLAGRDGTYLAVADRPFGCVLVWQQVSDQLLDPCRGTAFPRERLLNDPPPGLKMLPVLGDENLLRVDLKDLLEQ